MAYGERSPLLASPTKGAAEEKQESFAWTVAVISVMGVQISAATIARILLGSIDVGFLGHLGGKELAASAMAQLYTSVPLTFVWGTTASLITLCGQAYGAGNYKLVGTWLQFGLLFSSVAAIPVFVCFWYNRVLLSLTLDDAEVVELGSLFSRVISISIWPQLWYACLRQYFQSMGYIYPTTVTGVSAVAVSAALNYILIFGWGGLQGLGFIGSPMATDIAAFYQPLVLSLFCCVVMKYHRKTWHGWSLDVLTWERLKSFLSMAVPVAAADTVPSIALSMVGAIAGRMGSDVVAANSIVSGLWSIMWALFWGFGCASQVKVANFLGAGKANSARRALQAGILCTVVIVLVILSLTTLFNHQLFGLYTTDLTIIENCKSIWPWVAPGFVIESFELLFMSCFQGMGEVGRTFWVNTLSTWLVHLPSAFLFGIYLDYRLKGLWMASLLSEVVKLVVFAWYMMNVDWEAQAMKAQALAEVEQAQGAPEDDQKTVNAEIGIVEAQLSSPHLPMTPQASSLLRVRDTMNIKNKLRHDAAEGEYQKLKRTISAI